MRCKFNQELGGNLLSKTFLLFPPLEKALLQVLRQLENSLQTVIYHGVGVDQTSQMGFDSELRFLAFLCCGALNQSEIIKCLTMIENLRSL